jgi:hypothetical protein
MTLYLDETNVNYLALMIMLVTSVGYATVIFGTSAIKIAIIRICRYFDVNIVYG